MKKQGTKQTLAIDSDVMKRLRSFVLKKHGKLRGVLAEETTKALEAYMTNAPCRWDPGDDVYDDAPASRCGECHGVHVILFEPREPAEPEGDD